MSKMGKAKITSNKAADFVRVTFKPDFVRFGMADGIDDDLESLINRRVYDMAGTVRGVALAGRRDAAVRRVGARCGAPKCGVRR